ncbi:MAG: hypothetical protein AAFX50_21075, partial [Acidobacteriota bacterium]
MTRHPLPFALTLSALLAAACAVKGAPTQTSPESEPTPCAIESVEGEPCDLDPGDDAIPSPPAATPELAVEREIVERGHYRLRGAGSAPVSVDRALQILTDFDQHCADGCRWPVSSLDHVEVLDAEALELDTSAGERFTWTDI